jgi:hypothetical protein
MAKLNRFIINSDYDSLKIYNHQEWTINIPSVQLSSSPVDYSYSFVIDPGVYFESFSALFSGRSGYYATGASRVIFSVLYDSNNSTVNYVVTVTRSSSTQYIVRVRLTRDTKPSAPPTTTVNAEQIKIKLNLLVPSEQQ